LNRPTDNSSIRAVVEKAFAGVAATIIIGFVFAGTMVMCFPTLA
jgi:hypothetical protein